MSDHHTEQWAELEPDVLHTEWDREWAEYREWTSEQQSDRLERFADPLSNSFTGCVVCHERAGKLIYGCKCAQCFEAQREERDAA